MAIFCLLPLLLYMIILVIFINKTEGLGQNDAKSLTEQLIEIGQKTKELKAPERERQQMREICKLLACPNGDAGQINGFLKKAILKQKIHPDLQQEDNERVKAKQAFEVVDNIRKYIEKHPNEVKISLSTTATEAANKQSNRRKDNSNGTNRFAMAEREFRGSGTMKNLLDVIKVRENMVDIEILRSIDEIGMFLSRKYASTKGLLKKLLVMLEAMREEIIFHRNVFFNADFELALKQIDHSISWKNYGEAERQIDKLGAKIDHKVEEQLKIWGRSTVVPVSELIHSANQKIQDIAQWKENVQRSELAKMKKGKLLGMLGKLYTEKKKIGKFRFQKMAKIEKEIEKLNQKIREEEADQEKSVKDDGFRPKSVYNRWKKCASLPRAKAFFDQIVALFSAEYKPKKSTVLV